MEKKKKTNTNWAREQNSKQGKVDSLYLWTMDMNFFNRLIVFPSENVDHTIKLI